MELRPADWPWCYFTELNRQPGATQEALVRLTIASLVSLPSDYLDMLSKSNGGYGWVGDNYVDIWSADRVVEWASDTELPRLSFFASDGGGEGFAFHPYNGQIQVVNAPFIGAESAQIRLLGDSLDSFFLRLATRSLFG